MTRYRYSNVALASYFTTSLNGTDLTTTASVSATVGGSPAPPGGWPAVPFFAAIDRGEPTEEIVKVTAVSGSSVTFTRGSELGAEGYGTVTVAHGANAAVEHVAHAGDYDNANDHIESATDVHGLSGGAAVVGTSQTQTITNKTISGASNTLSAIPQASVTSLVSDLAGKAASVHSHAQSQVTDLVSDLAGKASTSHDHSGVYSPVSHGHSLSSASSSTSTEQDVSSGSPGPKTIADTGLLAAGTWLIIASLEGMKTTGTRVRARFTLNNFSVGTLTHQSQIQDTDTTGASSGCTVVGLWVTPGSEFLSAQVTWLSGADTATVTNCKIIAVKIA